ncbi:chromosome segregation protein SMC [Gulosibacter molinativorax]|uniref:Chromosome partition protein Smc n=1 Tax=Gulosibacter molinativorax TaxID=256821 RepID=A0ABT7C8K1_9MICO|nr:chromosome segregation protein SMC [Gulosibacter molinativorax]MDJ1371485.1 chromosome segregation protein SMC [Gulosibacter molinativorax]QUY62425.1 Chromosome partition protein Smc [Gulosibacter molinativorax]
MHLKSLTLKGFKSFAKPTTLEFEPGVTCVVGPNGSGKSNVVDALAWVMGEQGAKTLRGGKMEDVIFAGTATRGPLGRAEVALTIDNADGALPIDYTEVTIKRTLFRAGGSEYAINGEQVRLLDVQELLSDSGLGREMHVIVGQGRLDTVLRATPEERRGFIEEAAGILKHRRRKEKTVRKLEGMEQNLQRLRDLVAEVRRQLKPLGRQAEVARKAQGIAAIVRDAKARLYADEAVSLRDHLRRASATEQERSTERLVLQEKLDQSLLRIEQLQQAQRGDAVDQARRVAFDLESARERLRNFQMLAGQRESMLRARLEEPALSVTVSDADIAAVREEVSDLEQRGATAESAWTAAQAATASARQELDALDREISAQSALLSQHDLRTTELKGKADAAAQRLAAVRGEVLRSENTLRSAADRLKTAEQELVEVESEAEAGEVDSSGLDDRYAQAQDLVTSEQAAMDELRDEIHDLERERDSLDARRKALSLASEVRDGAQALLASAPDGVIGRVSDKLRVERGFETAISAALGATADAVLTSSDEVAFGLMASAKVDGRVELVAEFAGAEADSVFADAVARAGAAAGISVKLAADLVRGVPAIVTALSRTAIVDELPDRDAARTLLRELPHGAVVASRDGAVLTASTLTATSGADRDAGGASRIELLAERDLAASEVARVTEQLDARSIARGECRASLKAAKAAAEAALADLRGFDAELAARREALNRARSRVESAKAELGRAEKSRELASQTIGETEERAAKAKSELEIHESQPRPFFDGSKRGDFAAAVESRREAEVEARLAVETLRERLRSEQLRIGELERKREAEREAADKAARETVLRRAEHERVLGVIARIPQLLESIDRSLTEARAELAKAEQQRAAQDKELLDLREQEAQLRKRLNVITEDVHALELQMYERKMQLTNLLERAASELSLVEAVLLDEFGPDEDFDRAEQQRRLKEAEKQMSQLGRINPLALEEFSALEQRHAYLNEQLSDLETTRADLMKIVSDIDERMRTVFAEAFEDTREAFHEVFPVLFPGGSGDISLTDPMNMLATGIEVAVKPAGKKIDKLSLLSGGERSLAAVALLVAIFKARPSPFYIMDEVEAALDDANLGRLLEVFESLRESSQLIVITHQKRTMEIADALYGVSMHRDGVSTVVGQRVRE